MKRRRQNEPHNSITHSMLCPSSSACTSTQPQPQPKPQPQPQPQPQLEPHATDWPHDITYTPTLIAHSIAVHTLLNAATQTHTAAAHPSLTIRTIDAAMHPLIGQRGLFAAKRIAKGACLGQYAGEIVHSDLASDSRFRMAYVEDGIHSLDVDATKYGNEMRFINDYRGIKKSPNVEFSRQFVLGQLQITVWSTKVIGKGDEILADYGTKYWTTDPTTDPTTESKTDPATDPAIDPATKSNQCTRENIKDQLAALRQQLDLTLDIVQSPQTIETIETLRNAAEILRGKLLAVRDSLAVMDANVV